MALSRRDIRGFTGGSRSPSQQSGTSINLGDNSLNFLTNQRDALRIENTTAVSPVYGLVGYTVVKTQDGNPLVKESNTSNTIEFRFGMDVA